MLRGKETSVLETVSHDKRGGNALNFDVMSWTRLNPE
jgi:hypothetical protein